MGPTEIAVGELSWLSRRRFHGETYKGYRFVSKDNSTVAILLNGKRICTATSVSSAQQWIDGIHTRSGWVK